MSRLAVGRIGKWRSENESVRGGATQAPRRGQRHRIEGAARRRPVVVTTVHRARILGATRVGGEPAAGAEHGTEQRIAADHRRARGLEQVEAFLE